MFVEMIPCIQLDHLFLNTSIQKPFIVEAEMVVGASADACDETGSDLDDGEKLHDEPCLGSHIIVQVLGVVANNSNNNHNNNNSSNNNNTNNNSTTN